MAADLSAFARDLSDPARGVFAVTPSDTTVFDNEAPNPPPARAIYVGGAGNLAVTMVDGTTAVFAGLSAGTMLPLHVRQVLATGTTATNILGVY